MLPKINTLWVQGRLSFIERLCLTSMLAAGHSVTLYTYHGVENVPEGITIGDGRDILPLDQLLRHRRTNSYALGSDLFRYRLLKEGLGLWLDTDVLCLRPIELDGQYLFGWEDAHQINGSVLYLPEDSGILDDLLRYCSSKPLIPPWWPTGKKINQYFNWLINKDNSAEAMEWGIFGPKALTHFVKRHCLTQAAKPQTCFYPVHYSQAEMCFGPEENVSALLTEDTKCIHLWNEMIKTRKNEPPPEGSFLLRMCTEHGISTP